jgi:hypothetical protein
MKIGGISYAEKADAGKALIAACKAMTSPDPVPLGEYRGLPMELSFERLYNEYCVTFKGAVSRRVSLGSDIHGNITRLNNALDDYSAEIPRLENRILAIREQMETAKTEIERPFPQEAELNEKSKRLSELNILLNMDAKDEQIIDDAPGEDEMEPPLKVVGLER